MAQIRPQMTVMPQEDHVDGFAMSPASDRDDQPGDGPARRRTAVSLFGHARPEIVPSGPASLQPLREVLAMRHDPQRIWADLPAITMTQDQAAQAHLFVSGSDHPAARMFDLLRTQLLQALHERGWSRVAITAPTRGCGASFVAANLALALGRRHGGRIILADLDLRQPSLASLFGVHDAGALRDVLTGAQPVESYLCRLGSTLALALNNQPEPDAAELLQSPATAQSLEAMLDDLAPDVVIYDLPPVLDSDDVLAILPEVDGVLLVSDGSKTSAQDIRDCEHLFKDRTTLIGVVLNRAEDRPARRKR